MAILLEEPGYETYVEVLTATAKPLICAASFVECGVVTDTRRDPVLSRQLNDLLAEFGVEIVALTDEHARIARRAYQEYGRGSGHPAKLNLGDTFSYALATAERDELLFKGAVFTHTDVRSALG
ncbi:MAG: type II toxin-antitoxin system VapC family toxin [Nocardioides sp.]